MKPKKGLKSRTNSLHVTAAVSALVMALGAKWMPGVLTVETAALIAGGLLTLFASAGAWLKADDRRKVAEQAADELSVAVTPEAFAQLQEIVNRPARVNDKLMAALVALEGAAAPVAKPTAGDIVERKAGGKL